MLFHCCNIQYGTFFLTRIGRLRTVDDFHRTDCKAQWGNVIVILGNINTIHLIILILSCLFCFTSLSTTQPLLFSSLWLWLCISEALIVLSYSCCCNFASGHQRQQRAPRQPARKKLRNLGGWRFALLTPKLVMLILFYYHLTSSVIPPDS